MVGVARRGSRGWAGALALTAAAATAAALTAPAAAATGAAAQVHPAAATRDAPAAPPAAGATGTASRITLITGDVVDVQPAGGGRYTATVRPGPGRDAITFHTLEVDGGMRLLPSDAAPYVSAGVLDGDLFDVEELIESGYGDAATGSLPLIVKYRDPQPSGVRSMSGARTVRELKSIGGAALAADKKAVGEFWRAAIPTRPVKGTPPGAAATPRSGGTPDPGRVAPELGGGLAGIWLDGKARASLEHSVPQIGAPAAWQAGFDGTGVTVAVLDTGVDAEHADLAGRVTAQQNFSDAADATDRHGHGTHVASILAGSGAASGGSRRGVAPGARLLSGKVLADAGYGYDSWIIAGMEWAVSSGADVVNLSLGGPGDDGTDPLSMAVNELTARSGALFVIAAGNAGSAYSVGSPGTADAALTVGAVDRDNQLAGFSSRGPRRGDYGLKPEITGPGVDIVAARAGGTRLGQPVDDNYTVLSGTSMAAPHVAGAAALLAQANPDWAAQQLKDALVSTARPTEGLTVFQQGAGRVDVARAVTQRVHGTSVLDYHLLVEGDANEPDTRKVAYTNDTGAPVTLDLAVELTNLDTGTPNTGALTVGSPAVTVPAHTTVHVPVTLDPAKLARGRHSGALTATGPDGVAVRTAIGVTLDTRLHTVTIRAVNRQGLRHPVPVILFYGQDRAHDVLAHIQWWEDSVKLWVHEDTYAFTALVEDGTPLDDQATLFARPEFRVDSDMEILLDPRINTTPIRIETPKPTEQQGIYSYYTHRTHANGRRTAHGVMHFSSTRQVNVTPAPKPSTGAYEFSSRWQLVAPMVRAEVSGFAGPPDLHLLHQSPGWDGRRRLPLVPAGTGTEAELADAGVRGAAALVHASVDHSEQVQIAAAAKAGAAAIIIVRAGDMSPWARWFPVGAREPIPAMVMANDSGRRLMDHALAGGATIDITLTLSSPYLYDVFHVERDGIPKPLVHRVTRENTAQVDARYGENGGFGWAKEQRFGWRPWQEYAWNDYQRIVRTPSEREEFVSSGDTLWKQRVHYFYPWEEWNPLGGGMTHLPRTYAADDRLTERWQTPVVRPATVPGIPSVRAGDTLALRIPEYVDAWPGHFQVADPSLDKVGATLWRDGERVADLENARQDVGTTAADAAYRLELTTQRENADWQWATSTHTAWEFRSGRPAGAAEVPLPLLAVDYAAPVDLYGRAPTGQHTLGLTLRQQEGVPAPAGATLTVEVSFDEGKSWRKVDVGRDGAGYRARIPAGSGTVSLRVHARDGAGNTVTQTVIRAYGLR